MENSQITEIKSIKSQIASLNEIKKKIGNDFIAEGGSYIELAEADRLLATQIYTNAHGGTLIEGYKMIKVLLGE